MPRMMGVAATMPSSLRPIECQARTRMRVGKQTLQSREVTSARPRTAGRTPRRRQWRGSVAMAIVMLQSRTRVKLLRCAALCRLWYRTGRGGAEAAGVTGLCAKWNTSRSRVRGCMRDGEAEGAEGDGIFAESGEVEGWWWEE